MDIKQRSISWVWVTDGKIFFRFMSLPAVWLPNSTSWRYCGLFVINFCWSYWKSASSSRKSKTKAKKKQMGKHNRTGTQKLLTQLTCIRRCRMCLLTQTVSKIYAHKHIRKIEIYSSIFPPSIVRFYFPCMIFVFLPCDIKYTNTPSIDPFGKVFLSFYFYFTFALFDCNSMTWNTLSCICWLGFLCMNICECECVYRLL